MTKSKLVLLCSAFLLFVFLSIGTTTASTWEYSEPSFMITDPTDPETTIMACGHVPTSAIRDAVGIFVSINVTSIDYSPLPLPIETVAVVNYTAPNGSITQYDLRKWSWYFSTGRYPVDLFSSDKYQVGTYDIVGGLGPCKLIVDPVHIESTEYGNGWKLNHYSDGKTAYSNHPTYLRWDNQWIPEEWLNISNGNWSYKIENLSTKMNFTADGKTISIPKNNTKFDLSLFKISPTLTYSKTALQNNMVNVNTTVAYLTFPYSLSQIKDYADEHDIKVGKWMFRAGAEHIEIYDDVLVNRTFINRTGQQETRKEVTRLNKSAYTFRIVNDEIRLYFLKAEANKMSGNISFVLKSWTVGEGGSAWTGNSSKDNTTLNRDTNRIMLRQEVDDYLSYWRFDGSSGTVAYDEGINNFNGVLSGATWTTGKHGGATYYGGDGDNISYGTGLNVSKPFTVSAWVNPTNYDYWRAVIAKGNSWLYESQYQFEICFAVSSGYIYIYQEPSSLIFSYAPPTGQWTHLSIVFTSTSTTLYVNGIFQEAIGAHNTGSGTGTQLYSGTAWYNYDDMYLGSLDDIRIYNYNLDNNQINKIQNNTMKSSGNLTTWHNSGTGNETYQIDVNASTDATSNYTVWYANNGTGSYSQLGGTLTGNNSLTISGTKYQNTDVQVRLAGNTTSTPELIKVTFWTQTSGGGTLYEREASAVITITDITDRTLYSFRTADVSISISNTVNRLFYVFRNADTVITITDSTDRLLSAFRDADTVITITDTVNSTFFDIGVLFERLADVSISITDNVLRTPTYLRLIQDSISVSDTAQRTLSAFRDVQTAVTISDNSVRTLYAYRLASAAISVSDSVQSVYTATGILYTRYVSEVITVTDAVLRDFWEGLYFTVSGYVTNTLVYPLENARVELIGGNYTFSDATGHYSIVVPTGERNILGRAIGYLNETETVTVSGNTNLNLTLSERKPVSVSAPGFEGIAGLFILVITIIFIKIRRNP